MRQRTPAPSAPRLLAILFALLGVSNALKPLEATAEQLAALHANGQVILRYVVNELRPMPGSMPL